jgi:cold-inducible RNA-binding protein
MASSKLYVGNLAYSTTQDILERAFSEYGQVVDVAVVTDRDTGQSRGFGFVTMGSPEEAQAARQAMDGAELDGRSLKIDEAKEREPRAQGQRGGYGGGYDAGGRP